MKKNTKNNKPSKGQRLGWASIKDSVTVKLDSNTVKSRRVIVTKGVVAGALHK